MVKIYIEGAASLREGFSILLTKLANGVDFHIKMGGSTVETIRVFKHHKEKDGEKLLLIDLDMPSNRRDERLKEYSLEADSTNIFFMVQAMEAWFLSQQQLLKDYYGISWKSTYAHAGEIAKPKQELVNLTNTLRNKYPKNTDAVELLKKIDVNKLVGDFVDAANLRTQLNKL